jgi:hypothetical protein
MSRRRRFGCGSGLDVCRRSRLREAFDCSVAPTSNSLLWSDAQWPRPRSCWTRTFDPGPDPMPGQGKYSLADIVPEAPAPRSRASITVPLTDLGAVARSAPTTMLSAPQTFGAFVEPQRPASVGAPPSVALPTPRNRHQATRSLPATYSPDFRGSGRRCPVRAPQSHSGMSRVFVASDRPSRDLLEPLRAGRVRGGLE